MQAFHLNKQKIQSISLITIKYSLIIGIFSTAVFILFGNALGNTFYNNTSAGYFIVILSWLCPFIYLSTTFGSIINGLGKTHLTFFNTASSLGVRIILICYFVPKQGMNGYLISLLISQLLLTILDYHSIIKTVSLPIDAVNCIGKPIAILVVLGILFSNLYKNLIRFIFIAPIIILVAVCMLFCFCYVAMLFATKTITTKELNL